MVFGWFSSNNANTTTESKKNSGFLPPPIRPSDNSDIVISGMSKPIAKIMNMLDQAETMLDQWEKKFQDQINSIKVSSGKWSPVLHPRRLALDEKSEQKKEEEKSSTNSQKDTSNKSFVTKTIEKIEKKLSDLMPKAKLDVLIDVAVDDLEKEDKKLQEFISEKEKVKMLNASVTSVRRLGKLITDTKMLMTECMFDEDLLTKLVSFTLLKVENSTRAYMDLALQEHMQPALNDLHDQLNKFYRNFQRTMYLLDHKVLKEQCDETSSSSSFSLTKS